MPLAKYYGGEGKSVMRNMKKRYGSKSGERVFYATKAKHDKGFYGHMMAESKGNPVKGVS